MSMLKVYHNRLGLVDSIIVQLDKVANEYDEKLHVDRHPDTGEWALYIDMERPVRPYPVFLLGNPLPGPNDLLEKLRRTDSMRNDIRAQMNKANEAWTAEIDRKTRENIAGAADAAEYIARKQYMRTGSASRRKIVKQ